jgi:hypothetical protein
MVHQFVHDDGLYIMHSIDGHAFVLVKQEKGESLWIRDFASVKYALDLLTSDDMILSEDKRANIENSLAGRHGFYTTDFKMPDEGWYKCSFRNYVLTTSETRTSANEAEDL